MTTKQDWKEARAALDAIEAERDALLAPTMDRYGAAIDRLDEIEADLAEHVGWCEGCSTPIFADEPYQPGDDKLCLACAPTWQDMLHRPDHFQDGEGDALTAEAARALVDAHLARGGKVTDSLASLHP